MKQIYLLTTLYRTKPVSWWQINKMLQTLGRDIYHNTTPSTV